MTTIHRQGQQSEVRIMEAWRDGGVPLLSEQLQPHVPKSLQEQNMSVVSSSLSSASLVSKTLTDSGMSTLRTETASNEGKEHQLQHNVVHRSDKLQKLDQEWTSQRKYAYAFLLGGARSEKEGSDYRGGLYSVVVAAHLLRKHGSTADVILMVQISADTEHHQLPDLEEKVLTLVGVKIVYLPKFRHHKFQKFYALMMEKFRILSLTEYSRVLYLDFDVMPRCNLDYLFHLSDPSPSQMIANPNRFRLKENVGVAFKTDPGRCDNSFWGFLSSVKEYC
jgi:hypothetical protein